MDTRELQSCFASFTLRHLYKGVHNSRVLCVVVIYWLRNRFLFNKNITAGLKLPSMMRDSCDYTYGLLPNRDYLTLTRMRTAKKQKQKITISWEVNTDKCCLFPFIKSRICHLLLTKTRLLNDISLLSMSRYYLDDLSIRRFVYSFQTMFSSL